MIFVSLFVDLINLPEAKLVWVIIAKITVIEAALNFNPISMPSDLFLQVNLSLVRDRWPL